MQFHWEDNPINYQRIVNDGTIVFDQLSSKLKENYYPVFRGDGYVLSNRSAELVELKVEYKYRIFIVHFLLMDTRKFGISLRSRLRQFG